MKRWFVALAYRRRQYMFMMWKPGDLGQGPTPHLETVMVPGERSHEFQRQKSQQRVHAPCPKQLRCIAAKLTRWIKALRGFHG